MRAHQVFGIAALLAVGAQVLPAQHRKDFSPVFGFTVGSMAIDPMTATGAQVDDRSYGVQFDAGALYKRYLYLGVDFGGQLLDDKAQFTQNTTLGEKESTANVTYLSAMAGLRSGMPRSLPVAFGLNLGGTATMARRSIDQCVDCQVDKLKIPGGVFVEPTLLIGRRRAKLRLVDRFYMTGDGMRNMISAGVDFELRKKE